MRIIAELCQNHGGDPDLLIKMVTEFSRAGAWACKIQSFFGKDLNPMWPDDEKRRLESLELDWGIHKAFVSECKSNNVVPITSVYTYKYADKIQEAGFEWVKIGSGQAKETGLIQAYKALGFKVLVSTGGNLISDIPVVYPVEGVFHCVSKYPHKSTECNLSRMIKLGIKWKAPMGFSDHSDPESPAWANGFKLAHFLGAEFYERHCTTLSRSATKDGKVSIKPEQMAFLSDWLKSDIRKGMDSDLFGIFVKDHDQKELDLIANYATRWTA